MIGLIALREIKERGRGKGYLISTAVLLAVVVAGAILLNVLGDDDSAREVQVGVVAADYDTALVPRADIVSALDAGTPTLDVMVESVADPAEALDAGDLDVVFDGVTLWWAQFPDAQLDEFVRTQVNLLVAAERAESRGLTSADLAAVFAPVELDEERLDTDDEDQFGMRMVTSMVSGFGLFLLLQAWGGQIMLGVVEEKQSRVVEILLSKVQARELLAGKVLGIGVLGLIQAAILVGGLALALALATDVEVPDGVWSAVPLIGACFVLGFLFYGAAFAAVGAMSTRVEDVQSAQLPAMMPLLISYMLLAFNLGSPGSAMVKVLSIVPFASPLALPFRHAHNPMPWWQIALSLGLLAAGAALMVAVAGWVYRRSILRVDSRVKLGDLVSEWRQPTD